MRFEFAAPQSIVFGPGCAEQAAGIIAGLGKRPLLVTGSRPERAEWLVTDLRTVGLRATIAAVRGEPTVQSVNAVCVNARSCQADVIVALGGGSAIDTAKAVAALVSNPGDLMDFLEVIGRGMTLTEPAIPCVALPTTAGTGSEATRNAVIACPEYGAKASMRHVSMLPRAAIVDPLFTHDVPPDVTAATGMDALTQLLEAFVCTRANQLTDGFCREGLRRAARSLERAFRDGSDASAREDMAAASLLGGMALANAGLGAVHGIAGVLGGMFGAGHGAVCAALLPEVMRANMAALRRTGGAESLERYADVAAILTGHADAKPEHGADEAERLASRLSIKPLSEQGVDLSRADEIASRAAASSSMKANPATLSVNELACILEDAQ